MFFSSENILDMPFIKHLKTAFLFLLSVFISLLLLQQENHF